MDPFDDYDPQAYEYNESDQDDDIVYVEGNEQGEDPFLPYLAKDVELSQSQFSQSSQQQQETAVPNLLPRRERQRRRTEAAAQLMEESSDSEVSNQQDDDEEEEDAFASLQSLLEKQSQLRKEKGARNVDNETWSGRMEVSPNVTEKCAAAVDERPSEQAVPMQNETHNFIPQVESQSPVADDEWEPSEANLTRANNVTFVSGTSLDYIGGPSSISSDLTRELQRHRKQMNFSSQPAIDPCTVDSNLLSELKKNRKRALQQKKTASRPKMTAAGGNKKIDQQQFHRKAQVTSSKSIVGSRPQHWAAARSPAPLAAKLRKLSESPKSAHLGKATQPKPRPRASQSQLSKSSFLNQHARSLNDVSKISFAPRFFHMKQSYDQHDAVEDVESSQGLGSSVPQYQTPRILQRFNQSSSAAFSAGSSNGSDQGKRKRKQASKKIKAGPLMKRLRTLRSAVDGDVIRFQSGTYPFRQSASRRFDMKDPRSRATSYMDVSIICEPVPWDDYERITALGFVHNSARVAKKSDDRVDLVEGGRFAWICFTYATAREQNIRKGSQLRIYNIVCIRSSLAVQIDGYGDDSVIVDRFCDKTVLCTQLCESYPDSLPELPDVIQVSKG